MKCELPAEPEKAMLREWLDALKGLDVKAQKMFGCYCLYCGGQAVGWIHDGVLSLREVGLDYLPEDIKRPGNDDKVREYVIPFDYVKAEGLPRAVRDTAEIRRKQH